MARKKEKKTRSTKVLKQTFNFKNLFTHFLSALSLLPILIALWFAIPDFSFEFQGKTVEVANVLSRFEQEFERFGFREGYDFQEGVSIKYPLTIPDESEAVEEETGTGSTSSGTSTGELSLGEKQTKRDTEQELEKTLDLFQERINGAGITDRKLQLVDLGGEEYELIVELAGTREEIGTALPTLLSLRGEVSVWVDDPEYSATGANTNLNTGFLEGKIPTEIESDEVIRAEVINDIETNGLGLKVRFAPSAISKLITASQGIGQTQQPNQSGFVIVIDNIPVAIQSIYSAGTSDSIYFFPLNQDRKVIDTMAMIINQETLPIPVGFAESNSNLIVPPTLVNIDLLKTALVIGFLIFSVIVVIKYKAVSIPILLLNVGSILITIAIHKVYRSYLTIELLLGVFAGLFIVNYIVKTYLEDAIEFARTKNIQKTQEVINNIRTEFLSFLFHPIVALLLVFSIFGTSSMVQIITNIGLIYISALIIVWSSFSTFLKETLILPIKHERKNKSKK